MNKSFIDINDLEQKIFTLLSDLNFSEISKSVYARVLNSVKCFMSKFNHNNYSEEVGRLWIEYVASKKISKDNLRHYKAVIYRFNDILLGNEYTKRHDHVKHTTPVEFAPILELYLQSRRAKNQSKGTLQGKEAEASCFFTYLSELGCHDIKNLNGEIVIKASLMKHSSHYTKVLKDILVFLSEAEIIQFNYSPFIQKIRRKQPIPSVYSREERKQIEATPDTNTILGKRDKAVILLATRNGLRPSDIVNLKISDIDFNDETIHIRQQKTHNNINPVLLPSVKDAIKDYIENGRPNVNCDNVFITCVTPYTKMCRRSVSSIIDRAMCKANVKRNGRIGGARGMRSSLNSSVINDGFTYEEVRIIDGHSSANAIQHYAVLDDVNLRKCALSVHAPTGFFAKFLAGEVKLPTL